MMGVRRDLTGVSAMWEGVAVTVQAGGWRGGAGRGTMVVVRTVECSAHGGDGAYRAMPALAIGSWNKNLTLRREQAVTAPAIALRAEPRVSSALWRSSLLSCPKCTSVQLPAPGSRLTLSTFTIFAGLYSKFDSRADFEAYRDDELHKM